MARRLRQQVPKIEPPVFKLSWQAGSAWFHRRKTGNLIDIKAAARRARHQYFMPFYRFHVCDPINHLDGHGHDGAALADDIDAMLFAAGIIQRLLQEHPSVPRNWAVRITQDSRPVGVLPFEAGLKVLLRPHWACHQPGEAHEGWR